MVRNILVVDDTPTELNRMEKLLSGAGYQVMTATNGRLALEAVKRAKPDCIFMDVNMPEMDGFEATRQIRILERERQLQAVPIVALTAHILEEHRAAGQAVGMDDFLGKPLDHQQLYAILDHYLLAPARATD